MHSIKLLKPVSHVGSNSDCTSHSFVHVLHKVKFCIYLRTQRQCLKFVLGKLGHGDANRVYKPKSIEALSGVQFRKVICGAQFSMALTVAGKV